MKPNEALNLIDKACAQYQGTRQDHINLQEALRVLSELANPVEVKPKKT